MLSRLVVELVTVIKYPNDYFPSVPIFDVPPLRRRSFLASTRRFVVPLRRRASLALTRASPYRRAIVSWSLPSCLTWLPRDDDSLAVFDLPSRASPALTSLPCFDLSLPRFEVPLRRRASLASTRASPVGRATVSCSFSRCWTCLPRVDDSSPVFDLPSVCPYCTILPCFDVPSSLPRASPVDVPPLLSHANLQFRHCD